MDLSVKLTPKFHFHQNKNMEFLILLLNSKNENATGLGVGVIIHSSQTTMEQQVLYEGGVIKRLISLLGGSVNQKDGSLDSLAAMTKKNLKMASKFMGLKMERHSIL